MENESTHPDTSPADNTGAESPGVSYQSVQKGLQDHRAVQPRDIRPTSDQKNRQWQGAGKVALTLVLLAGLVGAIGYALSLRLDAPAQASRSIQPVRTTIRRTIIANGTILPRKEVIVKPQISGVIEKILVNRGDLVQAGDLLAVVRLRVNPGNMNDAQANLRNARLEHLHAKREFDRIEGLHRKNFVAPSEYDTVQNALHLAEQRVTAAQRQMEIVQTGASAALGRNASEVRATIDGTILDRPVETGTVVIETNTFNEGTTIVSIADMSDLIFRGKVDEPDAGSLRVGMSMAVVAGALPKERFEGRINFIAPKALEKDGVTTFEIRASLTLKPDQILRAGYSATAEVVTEERQDVLALPERYVLFKEGQAFVMIETTKGVVEQRQISVGLSDGLTTEITSGLTEADRVHVE